ncbi:MAG: Transcriptional regulatory protein CusR [Verrucomicrobiae bacterium]|nr:Transcriptional regulatory protein CusR [Verrucomicrobiae bacterium]
MSILVVEDDAALARSLTRGLREAGFTVNHAGTGRLARSLLAQPDLQLVLLDLGLPDDDGLKLLAELRRTQPAVPVLITTARGRVEERIVGLDAGADDYLVKPYAFGELLARIQALLRRSTGAQPVQQTLADLTLDLRTRTVQRGAEAIELTPREFDLLRYLLEHRGQTVSREMLAREVWQVRSRFTSMDNVIDVHISRLRDKIDKGRAGSLLHTVRGVGFVLEERR